MYRLFMTLKKYLQNLETKFLKYLEDYIMYERYTFMDAKFISEIIPICQYYY